MSLLKELSVLEKFYLPVAAVPQEVHTLVEPERSSVEVAGILVVVADILVEMEDILAEAEGNYYTVEEKGIAADKHYSPLEVESRTPETCFSRLCVLTTLWFSVANPTLVRSRCSR